MVNPLIETLTSLNYKNPEIRKHISIFRRTKSNRVKNKHFKDLFFLAIKEKKVIRADEVVFMDMDIYSYLMGNTNLDTVCGFCGKENIREVTTEYIKNVLGKKVIVNNVPALYCESCGDYYFSNANIKLIRDYTEQYIKNSAINNDVIIIDYNSIIDAQAQAKYGSNSN